MACFADPTSELISGSAYMLASSHFTRPDTNPHVLSLSYFLAPYPWN